MKHTALVLLSLLIPLANSISFIFNRMGNYVPLRPFVTHSVVSSSRTEVSEYAPSAVGILRQNTSKFKHLILVAP
jgi:hypothetical protein